MLKTLSASVLLVIAVMLAFGLMSQVSSYQQCYGSYNKGNTQQTANEESPKVNILLGNAICSAQFIDRHNGMVTAIATIFIAFFTLFLLLLTSEQSKLTKTIQRAFVFVKRPDSGANITPNGEFHSMDFWIIWENSGTTPTENMTTQINVTWVKNIEEFAFGEKAFPVGQPMVLGPKAEIRAGGGPRVGQIGAEFIADVLAKESHLFLWGKCDYKDVFGSSHCTEFCFKVKIEGNLNVVQGECTIGFDLYGEHNRQYDT